MRRHWRWLLIIAMPLFAGPLWSAMGRIDPLFMLPPAALAMAGWARGSPAAWRAAGGAALAAFLFSLLLVTLFAQMEGTEQAGLLALASGVAVLIHGLIDRIERRSFRRMARIAFALGGLIGSIPLLSAAYRPTMVTDGPEVMLITSLPLNWGTADGDIGAVLRGEGESAPILTDLQRRFRVGLADAATPRALERADVLLIAQPKVLPPESLVAIDDWVLRGGRALMLADPLLLWPAPFPLGDPRNPSPTSTLSPLLTRLGLMLDPPRELTVARTSSNYGPIRMAARGRLSAIGPDCRIEQPAIAYCRHGRGQVMVVADADWLHHRLWSLGDGPSAANGDMLTAANAPAMTAMLERLAGASPRRAAIVPVWRR